MTISENLSVIDIYLLFFVTSRITYLNGSLFLATFYFTFSLRSSTFYEILITSGAVKNIFVAWQKNQDMTTLTKRNFVTYFWNLFLWID